LADRGARLETVELSLSYTGQRPKVHKLTQPDVLTIGDEDVAAIQLVDFDAEHSFSVSDLAASEEFETDNSFEAVLPGDLLVIPGFPRLGVKGSEAQIRPVLMHGWIMSDPAHQPDPPLMTDENTEVTGTVVLYCL